MPKFTATIEAGPLTFEIKALVNEDGVFVHEVMFGDKAMYIGQACHFIKAYGETDLDDEVMRQYLAEQDKGKMNE